MKKTLFAIAAASLVLGASANAAPDKGPNKWQQKGEARLAKMIAGKVAGKPRSCISATVSDRLHVIDQTAIVYDAGGTVYVARPADPRSLDSDDVLIINRFGSQLCKQDVIRTVDRTMGFTTGVVFLGDFVPYSKPG